MEHKLRELIYTDNINYIINHLNTNRVSQDDVCEALKLAASKGSDHIVAELYKHATDENVRNCAILSAVITGHIATVKILLDLGANINGKCNGCSPLFLAVERGDVQMIRLLIGYGAEVDSRNLKMNWTPLMWAVHEGNKVVADILIESGANTSADPINSHQIISSTLSSRSQFNDKLAEINNMLNELQSKLR